MSPRLALKVDGDTFEGTKIGIPQLLRLFDQLKIRASFFFTLGPDTSGRAIRRVFTQKGFLKKMLRSKAVSTYGLKTMLYGTLLPSPMIGEKLGEIIRSAASAGHDVGVHGWDHIRWHDKLDRMSVEELERDYGLAHETFRDIFGFQARSSAAPGWHTTAASLALYEKYGLDYVSDTRNGSPCFVEAGGRVFKTLEIPSTLPTWDEMLGTEEAGAGESFIRYYRRAVKGTEVHSIHTEVEGTAYVDLFRKQLEAWMSDGVTFLTLDQIARENRRDAAGVPVRKLNRLSIPYRGGLVSSTV